MRSRAPDDPNRFCILVQAMIGPEGGRGEESFDFTVCTPGQLNQSVREGNYVFGRHYLIVAHYDYNVILDAIRSLCRDITGTNWKEVGERLSRYGKWEFEDYRA
jgi:hypothetical protein